MRQRFYPLGAIPFQKKLMIIANEKPLTPPTGYRFMNRGEVVSKGDKIPFGDDAIEATGISFGTVVKNYEHYLRRCK